MSRKSKIDPAEKVKIVEGVLAAEIGVCEAGRLAGVNESTIRQWRDLYLSDGPTALMTQHKTRLILRRGKEVSCAKAL